MPIDHLFSGNLESLDTLNLDFELPQILYDTGDELQIPEPQAKQVITNTTFSRLKILVISYQSESLFLSWVDTFALFT